MCCRAMSFSGLSGDQRLSQHADAEPLELSSVASVDKKGFDLSKAFDFDGATRLQFEIVADQVGCVD